MSEITKKYENCIHNANYKDADGNSKFLCKKGNDTCINCCMYEVKSITLEGFVARDDNGALWFYDKMPVRNGGHGWRPQNWSESEYTFMIDKDKFPNIKPNDKPSKVTLTITLK